MTTGLGRIARYLINEALVKTDDITDNEVPEYVEGVISDLLEKIEVQTRGHELASDIIGQWQHVAADRLTELTSLRARLAAAEKLAEAANDIKWVIGKGEKSFLSTSVFFVDLFAKAEAFRKAGKG
jgi:hypothetical protein